MKTFKIVMRDMDLAERADPRVMAVVKYIQVYCPPLPVAVKVEAAGDVHYFVIRNDTFDDLVVTRINRDEWEELKQTELAL